MKLSLRSCRLGEDRLGENLVRVAPLEQLTREQQERRKYEEEKSLAGPLRTTYRRLSYARARDLAPLLQKSLSPRGQIAFDERTNTLIITDIAR
jgi:type IV pilus assembly protein PilQ